MKEYALAFLAGVWLADGLSLLIVPRPLIDRFREIALSTPGLFRWQALTAAAGIALLVLGFDLAYRPLWILTGMGMVAKGLFLWLGPIALRERMIEWCATREDVDYRLWGLGLCTLAVLLLHALGWIGHL